MDATTDVDLNFEPQIRARSNTWPLRPREVEPQNSPTHEEASAESQAKDSLTVNKKTSSRRNAWGNLSYADLITKAIQSSPDQRLTLSQIYDWMVQNVPYFKDKGDSTSSAGWKNSIRHNLSLHSRFMRVPNEGSGKSSWWVINPDAKPGKTPRRRAGSMETKVYEKKKNRAKKKAEQLRALEQGSNSPSASSDGDILSDSPVPAFQLSPDFDFRPRASSNASSCGRLSPIQAAAEPDLHDNQVPPMSPIHWNSTEMETEGVNSLDTFADQLVDTLAGSMTLSDKNLQQQLFETGNGDSFTVPQYNQEASFNQYRDYATPPPPYPEHLCQSPQPQVSHQKQQQAQSQPQQQHLTQLTSMESLSLSSHDNYSMGLGMQNGSGIKLYSQAQDQLFQQGSLVGAEPTLSTGIVDSSQQLSAQESQPQSQLHSISCSQPHTSSHDRKSPLSTPVALMGTYQVCKPQQSPQSRVSPHQRSPQTSPQPKLDSSLVQQHLQTTNNSILRAALMQNPQPIRVPPCTSPSQSYSNQYSAELFGNPITSYTCGNGGTVSTNSISNCRLMNQASAGRGSQLSTCMNGGVSSQLSQVDTTICPTMNLQLPAGHSGTIMDVQSQATQAASSRNQLNEIFPTDIDIEMLWNSTNLECDMAAVIEHELSLNENLDFNFDPLSGMAPVADSQNTIQ